MKSVNDLSGENVAMEWKKELDSLHTAQYWNKQAKKAETHAEIALVMGVYSADDYTPATKRISYSTRRGGLVL